MKLFLHRIAKHPYCNFNLYHIGLANRNAGKTNWISKVTPRRDSVLDISTFMKSGHYWRSTLNAQIRYLMELMILSSIKVFNIDFIKTVFHFSEITVILIFFKSHFF